MLSGRFVALPIVALLAACAAGSPTEGEAAASAVDRETFVEVYTELRQAASQADGSADFEARKNDILARHGIPAEALLHFIEAHDHDVRYLAELWDTIAARLAPADEGDPPVDR